MILMTSDSRVWVYMCLTQSQLPLGTPKTAPELNSPVCFFACFAFNLCSSLLKDDRLSKGAILVILLSKATLVFFFLIT